MKKGFKPKKRNNVLTIYIHDAKVEIGLPPFDEIAHCSHDIAAKLIKTRLNDLAYAATRVDAGILDTPIGRHKFQVSTEETELAATLARIIRMAGNHKPKPKTLTTEELALMC